MRCKPRLPTTDYRLTIDSVKECVVCTTIANRQKFISNEENNINREKLTELAKMINGLKKYLKP